MTVIPCILAVLCFFTCAAGFACARDTVKIGLITPLTGGMKAYGESVKNAFNIAVADYDKKGRYNIRALMANDGNDAAEGVDAALKLITRDKVAAIVGPLTSRVAIAVGEIATEHQVPMITGTATHPNVTFSDGRRKSFVFRACFIDPFQGVLAANFALRNLKAKTAIILYNAGSDYSREMGEHFGNTFTNGTGTVVARDSYRTNADLPDVIEKMAPPVPDVIFLPDYYGKVASISRLLNQKGIRSTLMGGDGWDSPDLLATGGASIVGGYFVNHYSPDRGDALADSFIRRYKASHGVVPDVFAALAYDATTILLNALDAATRPRPEDIRRALAATKGHRGITGIISIDAKGDAVKTAVIMRVEESGFKYVTTINP